MFKFKKEKRRFRRYKSHTIFNLLLGESSFEAEMIDYSVSGVSIIIKGNPQIFEDSVININIPEPEINTDGRVVWKRQTREGVMAGIERLGPLTGLLMDYRLSDLLIGIHRAKKTGVLEIRSDPILKRVYIRNGEIIFSASNQAADRLGEVLIEEGKINQEQYDQSVELLKKTGKRQGTILVELGYLKPQELFWAVRHQVEKIILGLFNLKDGGFHFKEGPLPSEEVITLKLSVANLVFKGITSINDKDYLESLFPSLDAVLCPSPDPLDLFQDIRLDDFDRQILLLIDGKNKIKDILPLSPSKEFDTLRTIYGLLSTRIIIDEKDVEPELEPETKLVNTEAIGEQSLEVHQDVIDGIEDMYKQYKSLGYYRVLGIKEWASNDEIKKAYFRTAKEFHPDRHLYLPEEMKDKLNAIFVYITNAYSTLIDPQKRKEYNMTPMPNSAKQLSDTELEEE
jgi:DnaJ-domain-containing protein 1